MVLALRMAVRVPSGHRIATHGHRGYEEIGRLVYEAHELTEEGIAVIDQQEIWKLSQNPSHGRGIGEDSRTNARHRHSRAGGNPGVGKRWSGFWPKFTPYPDTGPE